MLWSCGSRMLEASKSFGGIFGHGEVNGSILVVPVKMDAAEDFAIVVNGDVIMFFEGVD